MQLVDTNIFLELELNQEKSEKCIQFLQKVAKNETQAIITDFSVDAICILMQNKGKNPKDIRQFLVSLLAFKGMKIYFTTIFDKILSTSLMEKHGLDFDDALILQAMHSNNIKEIVSFDKDFDKIKGIKRIVP